jgi:hypothetical protein
MRRIVFVLVALIAVDQGGHFAAWEQPELFAADCVPRSDHFGRHADHQLSI